MLRRRRECCQTCGREYPPPFTASATVRRRLVEILAHRPDGVSVRELTELVYADGGPLTAQRSLNVIAHHANKQLAPQGYQIRAAWCGRVPSIV